MSDGGQYFLELRIQGDESGRLKPGAHARKLSNGKNTGVSSLTQGLSSGIGSSFFEARYPIQPLLKYLDDDTSYRAEMRAWLGKPVNTVYDTTDKFHVSFVD